ncbi:hypothetical protein OOK39_40630 [Streptomyces sp. NBC_00264]|uniref:hypothetical protein n=1 Tax=unclassified Streptomyces TaxID=2593676 RepID=UPI000F5BB2C0|nr:MULTISPECIES: hypothetical protein [unclassified Streptomyces]WSG55594.1 hypothetical protein OHA38_40875 [Streptomyces sp. NBC_01732]WSX06732.1 hypothetical protein OG355_43750 [Streptomyces sp. NBC_00987]WSX32668.1 hypothetical protein OG520_39485 [Streptomyces sp. NBC_00984]MCX4391363.1 hypothetical protein [Streptomyces sp. NBC_01767]MCX5165443.1 hypothetical protein [Streptomyces sp. NBC_00305]
MFVKSVLSVAAVSATLLIPATSAPASPAATREVTRHCDAPPLADLNARLKGYGASYKSTHVRLWQYRISDKTYAEITSTKRPDVKISLERTLGNALPNSKPNMVCGPTKISEIGIGIRFGFFNNADHSVRVCILYPREKKHCGKWYAEDSNGEHV